MRIALNIITLLSFINIFSQATFEEMPEGTKEIHFEYERKSNYYINEKGVYADSLLIMLDFPKVKFENATHPLDSTKITKFIPFKHFDSENRKYLASILYHSNEKSYATYYVSSMITVVYVKRDDEEIKKIFKKYLKTSYNKFEYRTQFDFRNKTVKIDFPRNNYFDSFKSIEKEIYYNSEVEGNFYQEVKEKTFKSMVYMNNKLVKYVTPIIFTNNNFGVEKIVNINDTIELKSVIYK